MPPKIISKFRKLLHTPCYEALNNGRTRFPSFQTIDEASLQRLVRQYSQVCSTPYGWKGDGTPCYILLFVSSLGASLETVQLVYNANPTVVSNWSADSGYWKEIFHRAPANVLEFLLNKYPQIVSSIVVSSLSIWLYSISRNGPAYSLCRPSPLDYLSTY